MQLYTVLALIFWAFAHNPNPQQVPQSFLTLVVDCDQGIVDARHRVTVTVDDGPLGLPPVTVTADLPATSGADDFAGLLCAELMAKGVTATCRPPTSNEWHDQDHRAQECALIMGWTFTSAKTERMGDNGWQQDDGHIEGWIGGSWGPPPGSTGSTTGFSTFDFKLESFTGKPLTIEFYMYGTDLSDGSNVVLTKKVNYANTFPAPNKLVGIGNYLASLGMVVTYPTNKTMRATIGTSNLSIAEAQFSVYSETAQNSPATWSSEFSFTPN